MTAQRKLPPMSARRHVGSRGSVPSRASSSVKKPCQCPVAPAPTRKPKIRRQLVRRQGVVRPARRPGGPTAQRRRAARLGLLLGRQAPSGHEQLLLVRREVLTKERQVARPVRHRAQERVHVGRGEGRPQSCVVDRSGRIGPTHADEPTQARPRRPVVRTVVSGGGQRPMCLPSSAIWLFTSTVRGSLSMAVARLSAVQRSSVSTESAMDQPA